MIDRARTWWLFCALLFVALVGEAAEGFYRVEQVEGRAWVVDPAGTRRCVLGVGHVPYGLNTVAQLRSWGFSNLGGGGDRKLYHQGLSHTEFLGFDGVCYMKDPDRYICAATGGPMTAMPNMFHPQFATFCEELAAKRCAPCRDDRDLLGYFLDNELAWWGTGALDEGLFDCVANLPPVHSARKALEAFVDGRSVTHELKLAFLAYAAETYFSTTTAAIRKYDSNHLIFGCRFAGMEGADDVVWKVAGRYCDVISFNIYPFADLERGEVFCGRGERTMAEVFDRYARLAGKPILVSEWSFPALDTGRRCLRGAGQRLPTQKERVAAVELFVKTMLSAPQVVGYDFFKWMDQPVEGQAGANPEDCNYGLVTEEGTPYAELVAAFARLHAKSVPLHEAASFSPGVSFLEKDGTWTFSNAAGVVLKGQVGSAMISSVSKDGFDYGSFGSMVEVYYPHTWLDAIRTTGVSFSRKGTAGVLTVKAVTNENGGRICEVECRFTLAPDSQEVQVEAVGVRNRSNKRIRFVSLYVCPRSLGRKVCAVNEPTTVKHTPRAAYWQFPNGRRWGLVSADPALGGMTFALDANNWPHADCRFVPSEKVYLEPAASYAFPSPGHARLVLELEALQAKSCPLGVNRWVGP